MKPDFWLYKGVRMKTVWFFYTWTLEYETLVPGRKVKVVLLEGEAKDE